MKLLLINYPYLREELREAGAEVMCAGSSPDCDVVLGEGEYDIKNILRRVNFQSDFIVYMDSVERMVPRGLEDCPVPLIAFLLDSPINRFWQFPLAQVADAVLCDQFGEAEILSGRGINAEWFPLAADSKIYHPAARDKEYDIVFVGGRNPITRGKREYLLEGLSRCFNLQLFTGKPWLSAGDTAEVYRRSKLVLNENLFPAVNLRMVEAMGCGAVVLTEENAPGLEAIFTDGRNVITYNPDNVIEKIDYYLRNDCEREMIGKAAGVEVSLKHTMKARAVQLTEMLNNFHIVPKRREECKVPLARSFSGLGMKWEGKYPQALHYAWQLLREDNSFAGTLAKGEVELIRRRFKPAAEFFMQAGEMSGHDYRPWMQAGMTLLEKGERERARECLQKVLEITEYAGDDDLNSPEKAEFYHFWGKFLQVQRDRLEPGLMKYHLPMGFWSGLEFLRRAGMLDSQYWEGLGDLLADAGVFDAAAQVYSMCGKRVGEGKIKRVNKECYADIKSN